MNNDESNESSDHSDVETHRLVHVLRRRGYGWVPGLKNKHLADPAELERQIFLADWGPILALPVKKPASVIRPTIDENGALDWGAFGTMDFERLYGAFDKCRYKIDKLREELRHQVIFMETHAAKIPGQIIDSLVRGLRNGTIDLNELDDWNQFYFARRYLRVQRIKAHIRRLQESRERYHAQAAGLAR